MGILPFIPALTELANKTFDKLFPDKAAAEHAKAAFLLETAKFDFQQDQSFRDFVVAYEGKGEAVHPALQILRGSVRPVITYALAGLYGYGFLNPVVFNAEHMQGLFQLNLISLGFWYGERALKNLGMNLNKKDTK